MRIVISSDHGGFRLKEVLKSHLAGKKIETEDLGCFNADSVDYPDFAARAAEEVAMNRADSGIVICTTGIGASIVANKFPGVRAALCLNPHMAKMSRAHNNANVLALGGALINEDAAKETVDCWLATRFDAGERHSRRVRKIEDYAQSANETAGIARTDPEIYAVIRGEASREKDNLELIASENYASRAVREAAGCLMTNKYAEGYPGKRWYDGCQFVDKAEQLAIDRAKELFGAEHANVQPHCGSSANLAVYFAALNPGDRVLAMDIAHGGHLTHGMKTNLSGRLFDVRHYGVSRRTEQLDYDEIAGLAREHRPKLIVAGASAYPRAIDFEKFRAIADSVSALLMVDMAHIAGLVAAGCHPSPVPYAEFVTSTTHKTLRGPRSGLILCQKRFAQDIDRQIFPGMQGGPLMHIIAAKAVCFHEALQPEFKQYQQQVLRNARALAETLQSEGLRIISGGTDNHLMLADLTPMNITGKAAAVALDKAGITANKNLIPFDAKSPFVTSGIRLGSPAVTTRGMKEEEMRQISALIMEALRNINDEGALEAVRRKATNLTNKFPLP
ncbi:MAG: ribose 5-phosphate isomerase B [Kiritimatiellae bacterium]|nr:ribose 5-phosphate isomerase B [Kiritimatiellia bacterium]